MGARNYIMRWSNVNELICYPQLQDEASVQYDMKKDVNAGSTSLFISYALAVLKIPRHCLKNVNMPKRRVFFRYAALIFLAIHQGLLRQIALPGEKIPRRWAHFQFSNKT